MVSRWSCDFETTTDPSDCRVWAYGCYSLFTHTFLYGNRIEDFIAWLSEQNKSIIYFHNLKFDAEFIIAWLFENGWTHTTERELSYCKSFSTLISDKGMFYCMELLFDNGNTVKILDSLKILPFSVKKIAEAFKLETQKETLDYKTFRPVGHVLSDQEVSYLKADVKIVALGLETILDQNLTKMTQGSNALQDYKDVIGKKRFKKWYPEPAYDAFVRKSYKGGFTYLNPSYADRDVENGIVLDVNSLYPWVMHECYLPWGEGVFYTGAYQSDASHPLFVQHLRCAFDLKPGYIPTIQLKNSVGFKPTEYVTTSECESIELWLTSVDLRLFLEHYQVHNVEYIDGYKFKASNGMFKEYIDKWYKVKEQATIDKNAPLRQLAKLMLNALYGKFALNPNVQSKIPYLSDRVVHYQLGEKETRKPLYIPVGTFVTAWARNKTIRSAQACFDRFIYSDTDSLHLEGTDLPENLEVHPTKLGAWAHESTFEKGRFIRAKSYAEVIDGELKITCAGMPEKCYQGADDFDPRKWPKGTYNGVTFDNFRKGSVFAGKLRHVHVPGGVVLMDTPFTIKE